MTVKIPKPPSKLEATFDLHLMGANLPEIPQKEFRFHPERKWRFDYAFPGQKLAVELNGGIYGGRHVRPQGYQNDREKVNAAILMGWRVLEFTAHHVNSLQAIKLTREALQA